MIRPFAFHGSTLTVTAHHENLDSSANLSASTSGWLRVDRFRSTFALLDVLRRHSAGGPGGERLFPHVLLSLLLFPFQAYTIQGQYAIPHPDVSFHTVAQSFDELRLIHVQSSRRSRRDSQPHRPRLWEGKAELLPVPLTAYSPPLIIGLDPSWRSAAFRRGSAASDEANSKLGP